jgi:hypothetical protein
VGLPEGIKDITRADFRNEKWIQAIEGKGYRIAWSRTAQCPCKSVADQTDQSDPNCSLCKGSGWIFFRPVGAVSNPKIIGPLDNVQQKVVADNAAVIHGVMTSLGNAKKPWEQTGPRLEGMAMCTVRAENKIGYYDRITCLDAKIVYSQLLTAPGPGQLMTTRYPVVEVNLLRTKETVYTEGGDFDLAAGDIQWRPGRGPAATTPLVCHYLCHPTYRVIEHPHSVRVTLTKFKIKQPLTPQGEPEDLPVQGMLKYEFLL